MKALLLSIAEAAVVSVMSASAAHAGYLTPGETIGVSLVSPLPEGLYFADLETYGRGDRQAGTVNVQVNLPALIWSTPWSFGNTRLEVLAADPIASLDNAVSAVGVAPFGIGPVLAHNFGNGLTGGIAALIKTPTLTEVFRRDDRRTRTEADFRQSLEYSQGRFTFIENLGVTSALGQSSYMGPGTQNDLLAGDFALEYTLDKLTVGFVGAGAYDLDTRNGFRSASVELGGLVGYNFGPFSLTYITRSVYVRGGDDGTSLTLAQGYETRGWLRLIVPLYVAKTAPVVSARY